MATTVNDRDVLIMAAVPRFSAPADRAFFVNPEQAIFKVTNGVASPSSFNFVATLLNMTGSVSYAPSAGVAISVSGNNFSLDYSNMTAATGNIVATLVVDGTTYTRTIQVSKVIDGIAPKILDLAASSQVFKVDKAGVGSPGSIELIAYGQNLTGTPNFTILAGTATLNIGSDNTRKLLTFANMSTDLVTVQVTQDGQTDTMTIVKVREGADGANAVTGFLTNEAQTVPANLDGSTISMAGATTSMKVFVGLTDDTTNWAFTGSPASSASAITYTLGASNGVLTASALSSSVDSAYVDITATRSGYPSVTKRFSLAKSKTGPIGQTGQTGQAGTRGNVNISVVTSGAAWSDAEANTAVFNMTGTSARTKDVVNLYRADKTWAQKRVFDGFNWSILADAFDGAILVKGSVISDAIGTGAITADKIAADSITASKIKVVTGGMALNRDPNFTDIAGAWSGPANLVVGTGAGGTGPATTFIGMGAGTQGIIFCTERIPIDSAKTYLLAGSLYQDGGMANLCIVLIDFYDNTGARLATNWGDASFSGYAFTATPPGGGWTTYRGGVFGPNAGNGHGIPATAKTCRIGASLNANGNLASGLMALTGFRLEEQLGSTSIQGGAITADKINVLNIAAINSIITARVGGGAGIDQDANGIRIYGPNGVRQVQLGNMDV